MHAFLDTSFPIAFAHRGGDEKFPENTMEAFQDAYELGYRYFETDVHYTAGGELVAFHDTNLARLLGTESTIETMSKKQRHTTLIEGKYHIPLLVELLERFPDVYFNIDAKMPNAVEPLVAAIRVSHAEKRVCLASFSADSLKSIRRLIPGVPTITTRLEVAALRYSLPFVRVPAQESRILEIPAFLLHEKEKVPFVTPRAVRRLHAKGCRVFIWTPNDELEMRRLLDMGVDGLFTDKLRVLKKVLMERKQWV